MRDHLQSVADDPFDQTPGRLEPVGQVDGPEYRLEGVGEDRVLVATARQFLTAAEPQVISQAAGTELAGDVGQDIGVDQARTDLGEVALGTIRGSAE